MSQDKTARRKAIRDRVVAMKRKKRQRVASMISPVSSEAKRIQEGRFGDLGERAKFDPGGVLLDLALDEIEGIR